MIAITDFVQYAEVRAVLGVSEFELSDETLALPIYARALSMRLRGVSGTVGNFSGTLLAMCEEIEISPNVTEAEEDFVDLVKQLSVYVVAEACLPGLSMYAPKSTSDGKATETRFSSEATFKDVAAMVRANLSALLSNVIATVTGSTEPVMPKYIIRVEPDTDRVTE